MNTAELLPCPFCGSAPTMRHIGNDRTKSRAVTVKCSNPHCRVERTDKAFRNDHAWLERVAIEGWNQRPAPPSQPAEAQPVAYVPVHPRNGPLWAHTVPTMESDRPASYPVMPLYAAPPAVAQPGDVGNPISGDLHAAIMNLPCKPGRAIAMREASLRVYKEGHRDARHAAAELVAGQQGDADERDADHHTIMALSRLLAGVVLVLKGPEPEGGRHTYHDLPEIAATLMLELDLHRHLEAERKSDAKDVERYRWLRDMACNSLHLTRDGDHACNYVTASEWIEQYHPEAFSDDPEDELQRMKDTNTIWRLQIYPDTPIGFYAWHGSTLDAAIDAAMAIAARKEPT